jgi:hypothetical protein
MTTPSGPDGGSGNGDGQQPLVPPPVQQNQQYQQFGAPDPQGPQAPQWGQAATQVVTQPYPQTGYYPVQPQKPKRRTGMIVRLSILGVVVAIALISFLVKHFSAAHVDANGTVTKAGSLSVFSLQTGQCFDEPATGTSVSSIKAIPCGQAHDAQVTGNVSLKETSYDETTLNNDAGDQCQTMANNTVDDAKVGSNASIIYFVPNQDDWNSGDHNATCAIDDNGTKITGTVLK